jgi:hypothetical protein
VADAFSDSIQDDDEKRWAQAESILRGDPTPDAERALRRYKRLLWSIFAVCVVIVIAIGLSVGLLIGRRHHVALHPKVPVALETTGLTLSALGLAAAIIGFVKLMRATDWRSQWRAPALVLNRRQRRRLVQQIRGTVPVEPRRLALARDAADRFLRLRGYKPLFAGAVLIAAAQAIQAPSLWRIVSPVVSVTAFAVGLVRLERIQWQARRFLEANPE